jgi:hypothetical protein
VRGRGAKELREAGAYSQADDEGRKAVSEVMSAIRYYHQRASPWQPERIYATNPTATILPSAAVQSPLATAMLEGAPAATDLAAVGAKCAVVGACPSQDGASGTTLRGQGQGQEKCKLPTDVESLMRAVRYYHQRSVPLR